MLPAHPTSGTLTGWAQRANAFGSEAAKLLRAQEAKAAAADAPGEDAAASSDLQAVREKAEKQRAKRAEAYLLAEKQITAMSLERKSLIEPRPHGSAAMSTAAGGGESKGKHVPTAEERARAQEEAEEAKRAKEAAQKDFKAMANSKSASGRVAARLMEYRADEGARMDLDRRCEVWKLERSDGKQTQRDFVIENRKSLRSMSMESLVAQKKAPYAVWENKRVGVQRRLQAMQTERDLVRQALEQQQLRMMADTAARLGSPRPGLGGPSRPMTAADDSSRPMTAASSADMSSAMLKALPPRERAQMLRIEMERRRRWVSLVVLAARASQWLDHLVFDRNSRHLAATQNKAASMLQRQHQSRMLRKSLEKLSSSMGCLRKNVGIACLKWRMRKKVRCGDTVRTFLQDVAGKSSMGKIIHNFIYQVVRLQRAFRRYASIIHAQLGILSLQFDDVLKSKNSRPDLFLNDEQKKMWMRKVSGALLEAAKGDTRAGKREATRKALLAAPAPAAAAAEEEDGGDAEGGADDGEGKKKGRRKSIKGGKGKGGGGEGGGEGGEPPLPAMADNKFMQIDLDCRNKALSSKLYARKKSQRRALKEYEDELATHRNLIAKQEEMEAARAVMGTAPADDPSSVAAADGVTDIAATVGDFAAMTVARPPPRVRLMLSHDEVVSLIAIALLSTADQINLGMPVDAHRSVQAAARAAARGKR